MPRIRVKVCGITRPEDGIAAAQLGADAVGLVFYPPSRRCVTTEQARAIVAALPPFVSVVGLFLDASVEDVGTALEALPAASLQFHGRESPEFCRLFGRPYIKSVAMGEGVDIDSYVARYPEATGFLVDSHRDGEAGGTGKSFDWTRLPQDLGRALVLAGGLTPENVTSAIAQVGPYAVDVSSGVEQRAGIKDRAKLEAFMRGVKLGESG
jgi:phosphoribosylanthranilate isomerase